TLEILSAEGGATRGVKLIQKKELEGKVTFNPDRGLIFSLPSTGSTSSQVITPDRTQWDLYLIIIPFTLHKPPSDRYYEEMTVFGEGESTFYWVYEKSQEQKGVIPETKHVLVVLQVPRRSTLVAATISYEMVVAREVLGLWRYRDAATDLCPIQWDLSKALPFYGPGNEQTLVEPEQI